MSHTIAAHCLQKRRLHGIRNVWMAVAAASLLLVPTLHALTLSRHSLGKFNHQSFVPFHIEERTRNTLEHLPRIILNYMPFSQ